MRAYLWARRVNKRSGGMRTGQGIRASRTTSASSRRPPDGPISVRWVLVAERSCREVEGVEAFRYFRADFDRLEMKGMGHVRADGTERFEGDDEAVVESGVWSFPIGVGAPAEADLD